eukprot:403371604
MQEKQPPQSAPSGEYQPMPMPSSWSYGSFHPNSRFFNAQMNPQAQKVANSGNSIQKVGVEKRVVPEDYFRVLKEKKEIESCNKQGKTKVYTGGYESIQKASKLTHDKHPQGFVIQGVDDILQIDPEMEDEEAIKYIELPQETIYLIDKVVRLKAKTGPIGVDNSELINIELEQEFKQKNQYIEGLMHHGGNKKPQDQMTMTTQEQQQQYEDKENIQNQRLLERLTQAATKQNNRSKMSAAPSMGQKSIIGEKSALAVSHEEWMRRKLHEKQLKEQLIIEAKKDLLEQLRIKQQEEQLKREEKQLRLMQWEERKRQEEEVKLHEKYQKEQEAKFSKQIKQEESYKKFKDWLKQSLIKQREEMLQKKIKDQEHKEKEEREKKAKANMKVMAKIAYKEWKEKKGEEQRQLKKQERLERRNRFIRGDDSPQRMGGHIGLGAQGNPKKGEVMLAYGLNKNLKKMNERPKSAKPSKKNKQKKQIHFS